MKSKEFPGLSVVILLALAAGAVVGRHYGATIADIFSQELTGR
ncbi:hypothetical protein [Erwinia typographi]|nr:hypothetical protein [Erwinia typographi]